MLQLTLYGFLTTIYHFLGSVFNARNFQHLAELQKRRITRSSYTA